MILLVECVALDARARLVAVRACRAERGELGRIHQTDANLDAFIALLTALGQFACLVGCALHLLGIVCRERLECNERGTARANLS